MELKTVCCKHCKKGFPMVKLGAQKAVYVCLDCVASIYGEKKPTIKK